MEDDRKSTESADEALLREIREDFRYFSDYWADVRKERQIDMRYICGDPWEPDDRKAREGAGRPCISHDELGQYINRWINQLRQNKRGIKVEPRGNGATGKTAELRQDIIRTIEYRSEGLDVYCGAAQDMGEGSYGFFRLSHRYVDGDSGDQEIIELPIPNPDSVLYDPRCKLRDWSDAKKVFVVEPMPTEDFKAEFPYAEKIDFGPEDIRIAKDWINDKTVLVAEYWRVEGRGKNAKVVQYITNGVEILERNEQPGKEIPIIPMVGLERYVDEGGGAKRKLFSFTRMGREPQMSLAYLVTLEAEIAGQVPKAPYIGYVGQFETDSDAWEVLNRVPRSFVQVDAITDPTSGAVLPLPQRQMFAMADLEPQKDSARRAIQAAMGITPLPTAAQRDNQKSGVALDKIDAQESVGSYHFTAGYDRALKRAGRIIDSWIPVIYDSEDREMGLHQVNDSRRMVRINTREPYVNEKGESEHYPIGEEDHDVTVSIGPSSQSQHEAASDFADNLLQNLPHLLPPGHPAYQKLLSLVIKLKELGPLGDEMAEIVDPEQDQAGQMQGMQQQLAQQGEMMAKMQGEFQRLLIEKQGKVIDNEYAMKLKDMDIQAKLAVAEIETKAQNVSERLAFVEEFIKQQHAQAHEAGMQAQEHEHAAGLAQQQAETAQAQQASDQAHQMGMAQQQAAQPREQQ